MDTSCLLKLFIAEPESARVAEIVASQARVVVSALAVTEANIRFQRLREQQSAAVVKRLRRQLDAVLAQDPFEVAPFLGEYFAIAITQSEKKGSVYCKTLDRLHIAAAVGLRLKTFLTNDDLQARAAAAAGLTPLLPRARQVK